MTAVRVVVDSRVRIPVADLAGYGDLAGAIARRFVHPNPLAGKKPGEPDRYETWREEDGCLSLPRGGMSRVREELRRAGLAFSVEDRRTWAHPEPGFPDHALALWAHQERLVEAAIKRENCILHGATGSGKTSALYAKYARLKRRSLVMVWTENLLKQWVERAVEELGLSPERVGIIQGSTERIEPLTIAMQQTIARRFASGDDSLADAFDCVGADEVQRMAAETCYAAVDPFSARYRVGVSADCRRPDRKAFLIYDLFAGVVEQVRESETIASGSTVDVEVFVAPTRFRAPWYRFGGADEPGAFNRLLKQMVGDADRNEVALRIARECVAGGEQVLLFTHRVEHARALDAALVGSGIQSGVMVGGARDALAFDRTKAGIKDGSLRAAVGTYQAIAQGLDLPSVSRGVCVTPCGGNRQQMGQVRGRICRSSEGKSFGRLYYLLDSDIYMRRPIKNFAEWYRTVRVWDGREWVDARAFLSRPAA